MYLIETIKIAKQNKKICVVFFDFTDAFGSVDRIKLVEKIKNNFNIQGRLLNHIIDFLSHRLARIKINKLT